MAIRLLKRCMAIVILVLLIFLSAKAVLRVLPGDPVDAMLAETGANIAPEVLRRDLGLDRPFFPAALEQMRALVTRFDWGKALVIKRPIGPLLAERSASSAVLAITSLLGALLFSFTLSFVGQLPIPGAEFVRKLTRALSALGAALPTAWIGPILGYFLAVHFRLFTLSGGIALPALTLALALSGFWLRAFSETLEREMTSDAVRTARAKGVSEFHIVWKHAFFPAAGPFIAYLGSQTGALFAGTVITETIFDRPGLGSLLVESIFKRDYPLIESILITTSAFILIGNLAGDYFQEWANPKLRLANSAGENP